MSNINVEMPDGTVVSDVPQGTTRSEVLRRYNASLHQKLGVKNPTDVPAASKFAEHKPPTATVDPSGLGGSTGLEAAGKAAVGGLEAAATMATGTAASAVGGLMGGATELTNLIGLTHEDPVAQIRKWQAKAYQPQTEFGKAVVGSLAKLSEPIEKGEKGLGEHIFKATGSPLEATIAELMPDALMTITGFRGPAMMKEMALKGAAEIAEDSLKLGNKPEAFKAARARDFKISHAEYGTGTGKSLASASNRAEIAREASDHNQSKVSQMWRINQELPDDAHVNRLMFSDRRAHWNQGYEAGRKLGTMTLDAPYLADLTNAGHEHLQLSTVFKDEEMLKLEQDLATHFGTYYKLQWDANDAVNAMNYLRETASDLLRSEKATDRKLGHVRRETAEAIEDRLWRKANEVGKPEVAAQFKKSRQKLAQLHVWEDAANFDTGFFSPRALVAIRKAMKAKVDPFTDELKDVADAAGAFPQSFQDTATKGGTMPISVFERYMIVGGATSTAGAVLGYELGGKKESAEGGLLGLLIAGSGIAGRSLQGSEMGQRMMRPATEAGEAAAEAGDTELSQDALALMGAESGMPQQ